MLVLLTNVKSLSSRHAPHSTGNDPEKLPASRREVMLTEPHCNRWKQGGLVQGLT
jgi:hypothetical protein